MTSWSIHYNNIMWINRSLKIKFQLKIFQAHHRTLEICQCIWQMQLS